MVRVVVVDGRALVDAQELHAPVGARKRVQRSRDVVEADAQLERHGSRAGGVLDVVPTGLAEVHMAEQVGAAVDRKRPHRLAAIGRAVAEPVGHLPRPRPQLPRELVVGAEHGEAGVGQALDEPLEQVAHRVHVAKVVGMVELDVGHDGALGVMQRERPVGLVSLGDQPVRAAGAGARAVTHQHRRVVAGSDKDVADHVRDRGLARRPGNGDRVGLVDELGQHLRPADHLDGHRPRGVKLR